MNAGLISPSPLSISSALGSLAPGFHLVRDGAAAFSNGVFGTDYRTDNFSSNVLEPAAAVRDLVSGYLFGSDETAEVAPLTEETDADQAVLMEGEEGTVVPGDDTEPVVKPDPPGIGAESGDDASDSTSAEESAARPDNFDTQN